MKIFGWLAFSLFTSYPGFTQSEQLDSQSRLLGVLCLILVLGLIFGLILYSYRLKKRMNRSLRDLKASIIEMNKEMTRQGQELAEAYERIQKINQQLEEEVNDRTIKIRLQAKKLMDYTHFNSHKLRGPVARILGLIMLMDREEVSDEVRDIVQMLTISATELDQLIREFTHQLDREH